MKTKITITLDQARSWFMSGNEELRELALQAFGKDALVGNFRDITTFEKACEILGYNYDLTISAAENITYYSKSSAAMFKLAIIRRALNLYQEMHFAKNPKNSCLYYPYNLLVNTPEYLKEEVNSGLYRIIGKVEIEGVIYNVLSGLVSYYINAGLGCFNYQTGVCNCRADISLFGCATKDIAEHFGNYFGMLLTEAKYADGDFKIIESKYTI